MFTKIDKKEKGSQGFTLLELLIYATGLIILTIAMVALIVQLYGFYRQVTVVPRSDRVGLIVMDRIIKDIRSGQSIDLGKSSFGSSNGLLYLKSDVGGSIVDKLFQVVDGRILYKEDDGAINLLSPSDIEITKFRLDQVNTDISQGVRVEIDITFQNGKETVVKEYQGFAILRHSYE